jgi:hypothetical protein
VNLCRGQLSTGPCGALSSPVPIFEAKVKHRQELVSNQTYTVNFQMKEEVEGVQRYYSDLSMLGRHFLVYSKEFPEKRRQYTMCNCMQKDVYLEYKKVIDTFKVVMRINEASPLRGKGRKGPTG